MGLIFRRVTRWVKRRVRRRVTRIKAKWKPLRGRLRPAGRVIGLVGLGIMGGLGVAALGWKAAVGFGVAAALPIVPTPLRYGLAFGSPVLGVVAGSLRAFVTEDRWELVRILTFAGLRFAMTWRPSLRWRAPLQSTLTPLSFGTRPPGCLTLGF